MNESPNQMLIIGIVVSLGVGVLIGAHLRPQPESIFPSNYDPVAVAAEGKAARAEATACYALLTEQTRSVANVKALACQDANAH